VFLVNVFFSALALAIYSTSEDYMKIVSFNVNSLRIRPHQLAELQAHDADVIGLQETKVTDEQFPIEMVREHGYDAFYHGQKTHYGVAILVKKALVDQDPSIADTVMKGFPREAADHQRRFIGVQVQGITFLNGYFPQGEARNHPIKFPAKQAFYENLLELLHTQYTPEQNLVVMGDMNIAPADQDVGLGGDNAKRWLRTGKCSFLPEERQWYQELYDWGLTDSFRHHYPEDDTALSWFDYRSKGFERNPRHGLRIDHILLTKPLLEKCQAAGIYVAMRGMEKPSDHCPVWTDLALSTQ